MLIMIFDSNEIKKEPGYIKLYAEMLVQYENEYCENLQRGTPKWWDDYILQNVEIDDYHIYFICSCVLPRGQYNRVTDYKKVWGLNGIERGIYDNSYMSDSGIVYFGIVQAHGEMAFRSNTASTILLVKKEMDIVCENILEIFQNYEYDFKTMRGSENIMLKSVCELYENSILLRYNYIGEISLDIYGKNIEQTFSKIDISQYDNSEAEVVYRKP